jgi:cysteine synthase A
MFALEWCEFCWSVRKMLASYGIPYRSIDLDSVEHQAGDFGGKARAAVSAISGMQTIPQIFVGGCTEMFDAYRSGDLQKRLAECGIVPRKASGVPDDPYKFLPGWLHPR